MPNLNLGEFAKTYKLGYFLLFVSFSLFLISGPQTFSNSDASFLLFIASFLMAFFYYVVILVVKYKHPRPRPLIPFACWVQFILLFTISAFGLNQSIRVFAEFPLWLNVYTFLGTSIFIAFPYFNFFSKPIQNIIWFALGIVLIITIYFNLYLLPLMPLSILGFFLFGFSLHTFVPLLWLFLIVYLIRNAQKPNWIAIAMGSAIPLIILSGYLYKWKNLQNEIADIQAKNYLQTNNQIPIDIALAQWLPSDKLSEEILLSPYYSQRFWGSAWGLNFDGENRYHNPLAILAGILFGEVNLDRNSVESFLKARRNQRHRTEERLWTGNNLSTNSVTTKIEVIPQNRLAYHEKTLTIHYGDKSDNRDVWFITQTQQALYSFHLPEGSIVTSLSLWINGKEEKSRLTTRKKADSAFKEIVGVERRDPALVHWKEGNLVVVSVFPCTSVEDRVFKIGFTTPLKMQNDVLFLENIWFEGPNVNHAREVTEIVGLQNVDEVDFPEGFEVETNGKITYAGDYHPYWKFSFKKANLSPKPFIFNGKAYTVSEAWTKPHNVNLQNVYFDLNVNWDKQEFNELRSILNGRNLFVMSEEMEKITNLNADALFDKYQSCKFSLPYFHQISNPKNALVVSKSGHLSPFYSELKNSSYGDKLSQYFKQQSQPILFVNIDDDLSPIYKTLNELRLIQYLQMDLGQLKKAIQSQTFYWADETSNQIVLKEGNIMLTQRDTSQLIISNQGANHLMRLYAYNNIVRNIGRDFFNRDQYEDKLFREAEEAYVLSPVSSLIVLESEEDYTRMGIQKNKNTLGNAEIMAGGSVPEPHEWVLIGMVSLLIIWLKYKSHFAKA